MADIQIVPLNAVRDHARVLDLMQRAADYIQLETGRAPDAGYVTTTLTERPSHLTPANLHHFGMVRDGGLTGIICALDGHYAPGEWYIGLLLIDPAARNAGLGAQAVAYIRARAEARAATMIRIAVLDANPAARRFWQRQGFVFERTVQPTPEGDGHLRHVLKLDLEEETHAA